MQANKAIVGRNAFAHEAGIHQDGVLKDARTYEIMRPQDVGQEPEQLVLGRHSGRHAVQRRCDALGLRVAAGEIDQVYRAVISFGEHRKIVGDGDLRRIVERLRAERPARLAPDDANGGHHVEHVGYGHGVCRTVRNDPAARRHSVANRPCRHRHASSSSTRRLGPRDLDGASASSISSSVMYGVVPAAFRPVTLFTSMFLHGGWSHVIGNMWYLWIFGDNVEDAFGHGRFLVFYLLCGMTAALGQIVMDPTSLLPTIGASGAIAGVMGAYFVLYPRSRVLTLMPLFLFRRRRSAGDLPARLLVPDAAVQRRRRGGDGEHRRGGVAFAAHVAGFVVGVRGVFVVQEAAAAPGRGRRVERRTSDVERNRRTSSLNVERFTFRAGLQRFRTQFGRDSAPVRAAGVRARPGTHRAPSTIAWL